MNPTFLGLLTKLRVLIVTYCSSPTLVRLNQSSRQLTEKAESQELWRRYPTLLSLPTELRLLIFTHCSPQTLARLSQTSRQLAEETGVRELWKRYLTQEYQQVTDPKKTFAENLHAIQEEYLMFRPRVAPVYQELIKICRSPISEQEKAIRLKEKALHYSKQQPYPLYAILVLSIDRFSQIVLNHMQGSNWITEIAQSSPEAGVCFFNTDSLVNRLATIRRIFEIVTGPSIIPIRFTPNSSSHEAVPEYLQRITRIAAAHLESALCFFHKDALVQLVSSYPKHGPQLILYIAQSYPEETARFLKESPLMECLLSDSEGSQWIEQIHPTRFNSPSLSSM